MKYCADCGQCLSDNCEFCPVCGHTSFTSDQKNPYDAEKYSHSEMRYSYKKPKATFLLISINLLIFALISLLNLRGTDLTSLLSMHRGAVSDGQVYRVITAMFTHEALFHFLSNNYALYIYGSILEPAMGKGKFLFIYFVSGILGNVLSYALVPYSSIGASGAIFGLLGAVVAIYFINPTAVNRAMMRSVISCVIITTLYSFTGGINNIAHFGGLFGGYMACCIVTSVRMRKRITTSRTLSAIILVIVMAISVFSGITKSNAPYERQFGDHAFMCFFASFGAYDVAEDFADEILEDEKSIYTLDALAVRIIDAIKDGDREEVISKTEEFFNLAEKDYRLTDRNIYNDLVKFSSFEKETGTLG